MCFCALSHLKNPLIKSKSDLQNRKKFNFIGEKIWGEKENTQNRLIRLIVYCIMHILELTQKQLAFLGNSLKNQQKSSSKRWNRR